MPQATWTGRCSWQTTAHADNCNGHMRSFPYFIAGGISVGWQPGLGIHEIFHFCIYWCAPAVECGAEEVLIFKSRDLRNDFAANDLFEIQRI